MTGTNDRPPSYVNQTDFLNMSMTSGAGRSYKYYTGTPLFPFGFGLSYTEFDAKWATPPPALTTVGGISDSSTTYKVTVKNIGAALSPNRRAFPVT